MTKRERLLILDVLTLMATILVVMGHHKFLRESIGWYPVYDKIIYSFHMGFFMTVSGFLVKYTFPENCQWKTYVWKKVKKFVPSYFSVGLIAAIISFQSWTGFGRDLLMLAIYPGAGPIQIIWYIYVLLMYYCIAPFLFRLPTKQRWILLAISIIPAVFYHNIPPYLNLHNFFRLLPFFLLGSQLADHHERIREIADCKILLLGIPFLVFLTICVLLQGNPLKGGLGKLIPSALSLPCMYYIARKLVKCYRIATLSTSFSPFVYPVYLWQMFFINAIWMVWQRTHLALNDAIAVVYLICSVTLTIIGIVLMVKGYHWGYSKVLSNHRKNGANNNH